MNKSSKECISNDISTTQSINMNLNSCSGFKQGVIIPSLKRITSIHKSDFTHLHTPKENKM